MKTTGLEFMARIMLAVILMTPTAFSYDGSAMDASKGATESAGPSRSVIEGEAPAEKITPKMDAPNRDVLDESLNGGPVLTPPTIPGETTPDTGINDGTSDDYHSTMNDYMNRMREAAKLMEKWGKWNDYLSKVNAELLRLEGMKAEREKISQNSGKVDQALGDLLTAISNAPGSPSMPSIYSISQSDYDGYVARRTNIMGWLNEADGDAETAIEAAITGLQNEKAAAEAAMQDIQNEISNIMQGAPSGNSFADPPTDFPADIQNNITKANESMGKLRNQWIRLRALSSEVLSRVNAIVAAYQRRRIALNANQQAVVDAAAKLRAALLVV